MWGIRPNEKYQSYSSWGIKWELSLSDSALWDLWGPEERRRTRETCINDDTCWANIWLVHAKLKQFCFCSCCILIYTCMQNTTTQWRRNEDERHSLLEKYTSYFIWKGSVWERELETEQSCNILTPTLMAISVVSFSFSRAAQLEAQGPGSLLDAGFLYHILSLMGLVSKLTDFLSSPSYIIVQSPTQYLPIAGHWEVSFPLSLEWHVWLSSSGNNCHAVHRSLSSGASVYDCTAGFYLDPFCQPSSPTLMEYAFPPSLEWRVWPGRRSIYNN